MLNHTYGKKGITKGKLQFTGTEPSKLKYYLKRVSLDLRIHFHHMLMKMIKAELWAKG